MRNDGDVDAALAGGREARSRREYYMPHLAQAPMEPPAATARIDGRQVRGLGAACRARRPRATTWPSALGMPPEDVTVNVTLLGGGFGRKSKADFAVEAALLAREMDGKPVKVAWTREDDLHHSTTTTPSRSSTSRRASTTTGKPVAWLHRSVGPTHHGASSCPIRSTESPIELGMGLVDVPFAVPNMRIENPEAAAHTRIGWYRSVSNIPHAFAVQSFVAEMAHAAGRDPKDYLLELLGPPRRIDPRDSQRHLEPRRGSRASTRSTPAGCAAWPRPRREGAELGPASCRKGRGLGIAAHYSFVTYVAAVVEVAVGREGQAHDPARRHRDRLRRHRQPRARALADGRRAA